MTAKGGGYCSKLFLLTNAIQWGSWIYCWEFSKCSYLGRDLNSTVYVPAIVMEVGLSLNSTLTVKPEYWSLIIVIKTISLIMLIYVDFISLNTDDSNLAEVIKNFTCLTGTCRWDRTSRWYSGNTLPHF